MLEGLLGVRAGVLLAVGRWGNQGEEWLRSCFLCTHACVRACVRAGVRACVCACGRYPLCCPSLNPTFFNSLSAVKRHSLCQTEGKDRDRIHEVYLQR